jgi:hypothetical protein
MGEGPEARDILEENGAEQIRSVAARA